ncbi:MAG TPA: DegT/DnrJ/EryC1/StrS family aminotransferase [Humisphaera sp.]
MIPVHRPYRADAAADAVTAVLAGGWLGAGPTADAFERRLRAAVGARHVLAVASGTAALHLALAALDLRPGDEVLVPSMTFAATVQAVVLAGGTPVFCEVRPDTLNLDPADAAARVTPRTRVVLPVHYGGVPCDMAALHALAARHRLRVVEDAAHAFGSTCGGRPVGALGDVTCFSFDPIKNITCGEGGAVATDDDAVAAAVARLRRLGIEPAATGPAAPGGPPAPGYVVSSVGYRYHLGDVHAAIGLDQLDRAGEIRARKRAVVAAYDDAFADVGWLRPYARPADCFPFNYVVRVPADARAALMRHLAGRGVGSGVHYPPNHLQPAFARFRVPLPVTEQLAGEILTLPLHAGLTEAEVGTVVDAVRSFEPAGGRGDETCACRDAAAPRLPGLLPGTAGTDRWAGPEAVGRQDEVVAPLRAGERVP